MAKKRKILRPEQIILLAMLFLAGMNFFNLYFYLIFFAAVLFLAIKRKIQIDINVLFLIVLAVSWSIFSPTAHDKVTSLIKPFIYPLSYLAGINFLSSGDSKTKKDNNSVFIVSVFVISFGCFTYFVLNMLNNMDLTLDRNTIDIWTKTPLSATNQATFVCLSIGVFISVLFCDYSIRKKAICFLLIGTILMYNLMLAGRTIFVMIAAVLLLSALFYFKTEKKYFRKFKIIMWCIFALLILLYMYESNLFGIRDAIEKSNFFVRFWGDYSYSDFGEDSRLDKKLYYLEHFFDGIFGGSKIRSSGIGYAHGILLDAYDEAGLLALISMSAFLVKSVYSFFKFINNNMISLNTRKIVFGVYVAVFFQFIVEPILQASPWLFAFFCFISGMVSYSKRLEDREEIIINERENIIHQSGA